MDGEADALKRELLPLVPAAAAVCGTGSALFRLLCRAVFAPAGDPVAELKALRLARFAVDAADAAVQRRLAAWPHSSCCPLTDGAEHDHDHQAQATPARLPSRPAGQPALDPAPPAAEGLLDWYRPTADDVDDRLTA